MAAFLATASASAMGAWCARVRRLAGKGCPERFRTAALLTSIFEVSIPRGMRYRYLTQESAAPLHYLGTYNCFSQVFTTAFCKSWRQHRFLVAFRAASQLCHR